MSADMSSKMSRNVKNLQQDVKDAKTTWNKALNDANQQLVEAEERVKRLKATIKGIEVKIARGEPFP
jgi:predicted  nucleic acid-binding Zn-ribbon protein